MPLLEVRNVTKRYPGVTALDGVSASFEAGEVVAIIGENGAGKSTLMKMLGGIVKPDAGEILINGAPVHIDGVTASVAAGIAFIHQELNPLDNLDVAGNVYLGREPARFGIIDRGKMKKDTDVLLKQLALTFGPDTPMSELSIAQRQLVEIAKALSLTARILIMDEPTSSLTLTETETLLQLVRELRDRGVCVLYISHRLGEVEQISDRVVGLKDGKNAGELLRDQISHDAMVRMMVGRDLVRTAYIAGTSTQDGRLHVSSLRTRRYPGSSVSFDVNSGEIFCLAGLVGAGRTELAQTIFGTDKAIDGAVSVDGMPVPLGDCRTSIKAGIALVPEDRRSVGILVEWSIQHNISLPHLDGLSRAGLVDRAKELAAAKLESAALAVKSPSVDVEVGNLSGGNQQKVVLAKWMLGQPKVLILDEPTRGVDVGAKAEIYDIMRKLAKDGVAILMVSSDMEEVLGVSDRIGVMHEGNLSGILSRDQATEEAVMHLAVGVPTS